MFYLCGMKSPESLIEANKSIWNKRTDAHLASDFYDVKSFLKGKDTLNSLEIDLLGEIQNRSLLHLQCHFGQDTLSLARRGAKVSGLDFSETAIAAAKELNAKLNLTANFYCGSVYDTRKIISSEFDIAFTSYGVIGWLPDLKPWAKVISESLKPNGVFVMCEFHPYVWMMDEEFKTIKYSYFNDEIIESTVTGSYATPNELHPPMKEYGWNHPLSDVFSSLTEAGLKMEIFREYNGSPYNCFPNMELNSDGLYRFKEWGTKFPLVYGIRFRKGSLSR